MTHYYYHRGVTKVNPQRFRLYALGVNDSRTEIGLSSTNQIPRNIPGAKNLQKNFCTDTCI